jgi:hypothetical protein
MGRLFSRIMAILIGGAILISIGAASSPWHIKEAWANPCYNRTCR